MFIRWKIHKRESNLGNLLSAVLVQSQRRDGKPRQKILAYIASIREYHVATLPKIRGSFWRNVDKWLDSYGLDHAMRQKLEASIAARVQRPTEEELDAQEREWEERMRKLGILRA
jgi:hypothetical protein